VKSILISSAALVVLSGCAAASDLAGDVTSAATGADVDDLTCDDLVEESVSISEDQAISLLKVRQPEILKDNRPIAQDDLPSGAGETLVMSCVGTGVWSDGDSKTKVKMSVKIDADAEMFIYYQAI
jgi:hypothetical protein